MVRPAHEELARLGREFLINEAWLGALVEQGERQVEFANDLNSSGPFLANSKYALLSLWKRVALHQQASINLSHLMKWEHWADDSRAQRSLEERLNTRDWNLTRRSFEEKSDPYGIYSRTRRDLLKTTAEITALRARQLQVGLALKATIDDGIQGLSRQYEFDPRDPFPSLPFIFADIAEMRPKTGQPPFFAARRIDSCKRFSDRETRRFEIDINKTSVKDLIQDQAYELLAVSALRLAIDLACLTHLRDGEDRINHYVAVVTRGAKDPTGPRRVKAVASLFMTRQGVSDIALLANEHRTTFTKTLDNQREFLLRDLLRGVKDFDCFSEQTRSLAPDKGEAPQFCLAILADPALAVRSRGLDH